MRRPIRNIDIHPGKSLAYLNFERQVCSNSHYVIGYRSGQMPYNNNGFDGQCFADFAEIFADCRFHKINFAFIIMYGVIFYECYTGVWK